LDREVIAVALLALALCGLSIHFQEFVAATTAAAALAALFGLRAVLSKSQDAKLTLARKFPHVVGGLVVSALVLVGWRWLAVGLTGAATFGYLFLIMSGCLGLGRGLVTQLASQFGLIVHTGGRPEYLSSTFYGFSAIALLLLMFYPKPAVGGILVLTLSDSVAALVGVHGRRRMPGLNKTFEGSAAMFATSMLILLSIGVGLYASTIVALCAAAVEALPLPVDDNFLIPMVVGILLEALIV